MDFEVIPVTPFEQNCSFVSCPVTGRAAFVDPGGDIDHLEAVARASGLRVEKILLTHGHIDHCGEAKHLADRLGIPIEGPQRADAFWIDQLPVQGQMFGFPRLEAFTSDRWLCTGARPHEHLRRGAPEQPVCRRVSRHGQAQARDDH